VNRALRLRVSARLVDSDRSPFVADFNDEHGVGEVVFLVCNIGILLYRFSLSRGLTLTLS